MPIIQERKRAFRWRVYHAIKLIVASDAVEARHKYLSGDDKDLMLTAIMRRARNDADLRNAICTSFDRDWIDVSWHAVADHNNHMSDKEIAQAAAERVQEAEWYLHNIAVPQMVMRLDPENQSFTVTRTEGDWVHTETYQANCLRHAIKAVRLWDRRTIRGVPYLSIFAKIDITGPDGSSFTL